MRKLAFLVTLVTLLGVLAIPAVTAQDMGLPEFIQHTECQVDLTGQTITIYHLGDISSPGYSPITLPLIGAFQDAITYYNEHGGICGATLAQDNRDTGGDPAQTQAGYDYYSALDPKPDLLILYSSQDSELLRPQVAEDEIPVLISAGSIPGLYGENGDEPGWIYATNPLYADQFATFCQYVADNAEMFPEPVIGYMGWGAPAAAFGAAGYTTESIAFCNDLGVEVVDPAESFSPIATDVVTNVENLIDAGANILYVNALATGPVRVGEALEILGMADDVQIASVNWGMDTSAAFVARNSLGSDGLPVLDGMIGSLPFGWWTETDLPGIQLITEQAELNERAAPTRGITYLLGWLTVDTYAELYIQTVNRVGSLDAITGADMKETIETMVYQPLGLSTFDFQGGAIRAAALNRLVQFHFANADMSGVATSGDDALAVPLEDGSNFYPPILVPLTEFGPAPDTVSMMGG
jgi:hypothetical protein